MTAGPAIPGTVTFHLIRHGESLWNVEGRYQGQSDSGLTETGKAQAQATANWLLGAAGHVDLVASSDLPRVLDTAAPFVSALGVTPVVDPRLREVDIGRWAGRLFADVAHDDPGVVLDAANGIDVRRGGGETFEEVRVRVAASLQDIADRALQLADDPVVVVFAHGGSIRVATAEALGLPIPGHARIGPPANCSVTTLDYRNGGFRLIRFNHVTSGSSVDKLELKNAEMVGLS